MSHSLPRRHTSSNPQPKGHISSWLLLSSRGSSTHLKEKLPLCRVFQQVLDQHHKVGLRFLDLGVLLSYTQTQKKYTVTGTELTKGLCLQTLPTLTSAVAETFSLFMRVWMALESGSPSLWSKSKMIWRKNKTTAKSWKLPESLNVCF